jgi:hypothetical protein
LRYDRNLKGWLAEATKNSRRRGAPDGCGGIEAAHVGAAFEDDTSAKSRCRNNLGGDATSRRRIPSNDIARGSEGEFLCELADSWISRLPDIPKGWVVDISVDRSVNFPSSIFLIASSWCAGCKTLCEPMVNHGQSAIPRGELRGKWQILRGGRVPVRKSERVPSSDRNLFTF